MVKTPIMQDKMPIGSEFVAGESTPLDIHNPATSEVLLKLPEAAVEQVKQAVVAADKAFEAWSQATPKDRSLMLLKLADTSDAHAEELARLESLNCGKPYLAALNDEIPAISDCFRFFCGGGALDDRGSGGRVPGRTYQHDPPGSGEGGGEHCALELLPSGNGHGRPAL